MLYFLPRLRLFLQNEVYWVNYLRSEVTLESILDDFFALFPPGSVLSSEFDSSDTVVLGWLSKNLQRATNQWPIIGQIAFKLK